MITSSITSFSGTYRFLSNFYPATFTFTLDGEKVSYSTSEHAYQALKTQNPTQREWIRSALTPGEAKRRGRQVTMRPQWDVLKIPLMRAILVQKFRQNPLLLTKLLATEDAELIEGNTWGDLFWGRCRGKGENHLGLLLMETRKLFKELQKEK